METTNYPDIADERIARPTDREWIEAVRNRILSNRGHYWNDIACPEQAARAAASNLAYLYLEAVDSPINPTDDECPDGLYHKPFACAIEMAIIHKYLPQFVRAIAAVRRVAE